MTRPSLAGITQRAEAATDERDAYEHFGAPYTGSTIHREARASAADVPAMSAAIRDVLALHTPEWSCGNPAHTNPDVGCPDCGEYCIDCDQPWPCTTVRAITAHIDTESRT